jgi:hypothetical protein
MNKKLLIVGNWKTGYETNLRFFSSRRQKDVTFCRAALFAGGQYE